MNTNKLILIVILLIVVNNLIVLNLLGYFSVSTDHAATTITTKAHSELDDRGNRSAESEPSKEGATKEIEVAELTSSSDDTFFQSFQRFSATADFTKILDEHQEKARARYKAAEELISKMDVFELLEVAKNSEKRSETRLALQYMMASGKINKLELIDLRALYQIDSLDNHYKSEILNKLLEAGDEEALGWAKQTIVEERPGIHIDSELLTMVYEKDPDFIDRYVDQLELESLGSYNSIYSLMSQEPKLNSRFFSKHFDEILNSDNKFVYQIGRHSVDFDMSLEQQARVAQLFSSDDKHKRNFAINLAAHIESTDLLRESYGKLTRTQEKQGFLYGLFGKQISAEQLSLLKN